MALSCVNQVSAITPLWRGCVVSPILSMVTVSTRQTDEVSHESPPPSFHRSIDARKPHLASPTSKMNGSCGTPDRMDAWMVSSKETPFEVRIMKCPRLLTSLIAITVLPFFCIEEAAARFDPARRRGLQFQSGDGDAGRQPDQHDPDDHHERRACRDALPRWFANNVCLPPDSHCAGVGRSTPVPPVRRSSQSADRIAPCLGDRHGQLQQ